MDDRVALFERIGLDAQKAADMVKSSAGKTLAEILTSDLNIGDKGCSPDAGKLLLSLANVFPKENTKERKFLAEMIVAGRIRYSTQVAAAAAFVKRANRAGDVNRSELEEACGLDLVISEETIRSAVRATLKEHESEVKEDRYECVGSLMPLVTKKIRFAEGGTIRQMLEEEVEAMVGPRTAADMEKKGKKKKKKSKKAEPAAAVASKGDKKAAKGAKAKKGAEEVKAEASESNDMMFETSRAIPLARNKPGVYDLHVKRTGGKIRTRFPPEPNGFLHIGHAKAMRFNFRVASERNGECILRFDDTNPEAEEKSFIDNIISNVHWLGHKPSQITYSSDNFEELYELAKELIRRGKAYVCHQTKAEIKESHGRKVRTPSPYRDRPVEENLRLFEDMRRGKFDEGGATLRMKGDLTSAFPCMWDQVFYRIKYTPHPHVGDKWCIYPTYDFTHCLIDSLEDIDFSLCTLEFDTRRESYFWLLDELDLYKPVVWEYSRLNVATGLTSKRRLKELVVDGHVRGWDDPRLLTINGLRRRGFTPESINNFVDLAGVTRASNIIRMHALYYSLRQHLDPIVPRAMAVISPLRLTIIDYPANKAELCDAPIHPSYPERGNRRVPLSREVYIESEDFMVNPDKKYRRLAPGRTTRLRYGPIVSYVKHDTDANGNVTNVDVKTEPDTVKPGSTIHWVAVPPKGSNLPQPIRAELRLYDVLFTHDEPAKVDNYLNYLNPNSEVIVPNALIEPFVAGANVEDKYQFERVGYFCVDPDSRPGHLVFNRTAPLRDSKDK